MSVNLLLGSAVFSAHSMVCRLCGLFDGDDQGLCGGCRALRRIREVQCGGLLLVGQQTRAVSALRECAGALLDLAEEAVRVRKQAKEAAAVEGEGTTTQAAGGDGSGSAPGPVGDAASGSGRPAEAPTEAKEIKVKDELGLADGGSEESPGVLGVAAVEEEKPVEGEREEAPKEEAKVKKRRKKHSGTSSRKPDKKKSKEKKRKASHSVPREEEEVVAEEPEELGLRPAPKAGVARHFAHLPTPPPAPRRPRSPDHPPPNRDADRGEIKRRRGHQGRSGNPREGQRKRGSKGIKHRERGRFWPYRRPY